MAKPYGQCQPCPYFTNSLFIEHRFPFKLIMAPAATERAF